MLTIIKVIFCVLYVTLAEELYDVTTVYHVGTNYNNTNEGKSVEVHLRTNARGLPIFYKKKVVDDSIIGRVFPAFYDNINHENNNSLWQTKDWTRNHVYQSLFGKESFLGRTLSEIQPLPRLTKIKLEGYFLFNYYVDVLILPQETELVGILSGFYRIELGIDGNNAKLMYCRPTVGGANLYFRDTDGATLSASCTEITGFQNVNWGNMEMIVTKPVVSVLNQINVIFTQDIVPPVNQDTFLLIVKTESKPDINNWIIHDTFYYTDISKAGNNLISSDIVSTNIHGLNHGKFYEVRIILFDDNLNNYQGKNVPTTKFLSLCTIPDTVDYHIISTINTTSMTISWDYKNTSEYWCPVQHYQVSRKEDWKWITENTTDTSFTLTDLFSGGVIKFRIRALTSGGFAPYSKHTSVATTIKVPGPIRLLSSQHIDKFELISWDPPAKINSEKMDYQIKYQCLRRMGCENGCDPSNQVEIQTSNTNVTLYSLMPFTQYLVTVSAGNGPGTSLVIGTKLSVPTETVKASKLSPVRTNNSVTVFWEPVEVCSGFFKGYIYQLYKADDTQIVKTGSTKETHLTGDGLSAETDYIVRIYIENIVGWNADKYLLINISTSATVPEKVENLTVYKRGRNLLGLRWEQPRKMYRVLKSFTIHYGYRNNNNTIVVPPTPCIVWPDLYCHVLDNLSPNQKYTVTVAAKNAEVAEDGVPSSVTEVTKEGTAGLPESVEVLNTTSSSFAMTWKYPSMANGIIRSFLLSVEETERFESDKCCEIYPLIETTVKEELVNYSVEVAGLHPASTYTVSLSAKTVSFGPSKTLTIYTRPPSLPLQYLPEINNLTQGTWTWLPQNLLENLNNSEIYQPLIKGSVLLVILDSRSEDFQSGVEHEQLLAELTKLIKTDFYFVAEIEKGVPTITTEDNVQSVWGTTNIPQLNVGETYRYAAVQISEYCSVYNIDVVFSSTITVVL